MVQHSIAQQADPLTKPGVAGAFCRAYTVEEAIDAFLAKKLRDPEDRKECKKASDALARRGFSWSQIAAGIERRKYQTD